MHLHVSLLTTRALHHGAINGYDVTHMTQRVGWVTPSRGKWPIPLLVQHHRPSPGPGSVRRWNVGVSRASRKTNPLGRPDLHPPRNSTRQGRRQTLPQRPRHRLVVVLGSLPSFNEQHLGIRATGLQHREPLGLFLYKLPLTPTRAAECHR